MAKAALKGCFKAWTSKLTIYNRPLIFIGTSSQKRFPLRKAVSARGSVAFRHRLDYQSGEAAQTLSHLKKDYSEMTKNEFIAEIEAQKERGSKLLQQVQKMHVGRNKYGDGMAVFGPAPLYYTPQEELEPVRKEYTSWKSYVHDYLLSVLDANDDFISEWDLCLQEPYRHNVSDKDWYTKEIKEALGKLDSFAQRIGFRLKDSLQREHTFDTKKVFIVHGHNETVKQTVARTLESIGLTPVILAEQPDKGRTVIEKFEKEGNDVGFAVVLLTADDKGRKNKARTMQSRARQNVVFEMGYFMALLGRERVMLLLQPGVEEPSDLKGVVYTQLDKEGAWKYRLVKELREQGYDASTDSI